MTLIKRGRFYHYDFWYRHKRYQGSTQQELRDDAEAVERNKKRELRREAHGIAIFRREHTPSFSAWAETFLATQRTKGRRVDTIERTLRMVLAFWGAKPSKKDPVKDAPYHNLRLADPILDAEWIEKFETWMTSRGVSGSTKNSYRSALSGMYRLALKPRYRQRTRVPSNPFLDIDRDPRGKRRTPLPLEAINTWAAHAAPHVVLALAVGALAPKLRLAQVLALRFDKHLDPELTVITFDAHKTLRHTGEAQVTPVSTDLRLVLEAVKKARPHAKHVITFRGEPVQSIRRAIAGAAVKAGLTYGLRGGVTFHSLRGAMATAAARQGVPELLAALMLGHKDARTTRQHYIHLVSQDERAIAEQVGQWLKITDVAVAAAGKTAGTRGPDDADIKRMRAKLKTRSASKAVH